MAPVASRFDSQAFSAIPIFKKQLETIHELKIQFSPILEELGPLFAKYGVQEKYGLTIVHRHFDLGEDEILVEVPNQAGTKSFSTPWNYDAENGIAFPKDEAFLYSEGVGETTWIFPKTWTFSQDGNLVDLEFQGVSAKDQKDVDLPPTDFCKELYGILKSLGLLDILGLTRLGKEEMSSEVTDPVRRINIIDYQRSAVEEGFTNVTWRFDANGGFVETCRCQYCK